MEANKNGQNEEEGTTEQVNQTLPVHAFRDTHPVQKF